MNEAIEISPSSFPAAFAAMNVERKRLRSIFCAFVEDESSGTTWQVSFLREWAKKHNNKMLLKALF